MSQQPFTILSLEGYAVHESRVRFLMSFVEWMFVATCYLYLFGYMSRRMFESSGSNSWTAANVALTSVDDDGVRASCSSTQGGGAYTVFHRTEQFQIKLLVLSPCCSQAGRTTNFVRNSIADESEQGGITFLAVAIALPLIVMGSAVAGGLSP